MKVFRPSLNSSLDMYVLNKCRLCGKYFWVPLCQIYSCFERPMFVRWCCSKFNCLRLMPNLRKLYISLRAFTMGESKLEASLENVTSEIFQRFNNNLVRITCMTRMKFFRLGTIRCIHFDFVFKTKSLQKPGVCLLMENLVVWRICNGINYNDEFRVLFEHSKQLFRCSIPMF